MRKLLLVILSLLLVTNLYAADTEVQDLDDISSPAVGDDMYIIDDPDGTPASKKINIGALLGVASDLDTSGDIVEGAVGATELGATSVSADSYMCPTITVDADGRLTYAASGALTGLSDVGSATQGDGRLLISDGVDFQSIELSGDISITGVGVVSIGSDAVLLNEVGDPSTSTAISFADNEGITFTTAEDTGIFMSIANSDADISHATYLLDLRFQDDGSAYGYYLHCLDDSEGTPNPVFTIGANGDITSDGSVYVDGAFNDGAMEISDGVANFLTIDAESNTITNIGDSEISSSGVAAGSYMSPTITVDEDGRLTYAASGGLTGLSDVGSATQTAGNLLISDGVDFQSITLSGGATLAGTGVITLSESDPQVGTLTNTKWCTSNGTTVNCEEDAPAGGIDELSDLSDVGSSTQGAGRLLISDGTDFQSIVLSGDCTIGAAGVISCSSGSGDVTGVGDCADGACLDGTSDGGTYVRIYDGNSHYLELNPGDITADRAVAFRDAAGTVLLSGDALTGDVTATFDTDGSTVTDIAATGVVAGSYMVPTINVAADGRIVHAARGSLTGLEDVGSSTQTAGNLLISDGSDFQSITMSGDCTIAGTGVITCPAAGGGDAITVGGSSVDTTANFTDDGIIDFTLVDGGAGGPDAIKADLDDTSVVAASYMTPTITVDADGRITYAASGSLTGLADVGSSTQGDGRLLISDGVNFDSIAMSGDVSIAGDGITHVESIQQGANPTTAYEGEMAWDNDDFMLEVNANGSSVIFDTTVKAFSGTIYDPDTIQAVEDAIPISPKITSTLYPHGITITAINLETDATHSGTYVIEEWTNAANYVSDVASIAFSSTLTTTASSISDSSIAAGNQLYIDLDTTALNFLNYTIEYTIKEGD